MKRLVSVVAESDQGRGGSVLQVAAVSKPMGSLSWVGADTGFFQEGGGG